MEARTAAGRRAVGPGHGRSRLGRVTRAHARCGVPGTGLRSRRDVEQRRGAVTAGRRCPHGVRRGHGKDARRGDRTAPRRGASAAAVETGLPGMGLRSRRGVEPRRTPQENEVREWKLGSCCSCALGRKKEGGACSGGSDRELSGARRGPGETRRGHRASAGAAARAQPRQAAAVARARLRARQLRHGQSTGTAAGKACTRARKEQRTTACACIGESWYLRAVVLDSGDHGEQRRGRRGHCGSVCR